MFLESICCRFASKRWVGYEKDGWDTKKVGGGTFVSSLNHDNQAMIPGLGSGWTMGY